MTTNEIKWERESETKMNRRLVAWAKRNLNDKTFGAQAKAILEIAKRDGWKTN